MSKSFFGRATLRRQDQMSIEKPSKVQSIQAKSLRKQENDRKEEVEVVVSNSAVNRIHCLVKDAIETTKPHIIYSKQLPTLLDGATIKRKHLVFRQLDYIIANWVGTGFPNVIYIAHTSTTTFGYQDADGVLTKRVGALQLSQVSPVLDDATVRTYDLRYSLRDPVTWMLPPDLTTLELQLFTDDEEIPITLPLPNPMSLGFELRYQKM